jgi:hypothetical protein
MRLRLFAIVGGALLVLVPVTVAFADSGSYQDPDGPMCNWSGNLNNLNSPFANGGNIFVSCSGYSRSAGTYVNYNCNINYYGSQESWNCRDIVHGSTWQGHN